MELRPSSEALAAARELAPKVGGVAILIFLVPIRTARAQNEREHHFARSDRVRAEHQAVELCWPKGHPVPLPCRVQLTRISPGRGLDGHDNLAGAVKGVADELARLMGVDDRDPRITWLQPLEERGEWGVRVEISSDLGGAVLAPRPKPALKPKKRQPAPPAARAPMHLNPQPAYIPPTPRSR